MQTALIVYAADAVATGRLQLDHDRLSDLLLDDAPVTVSSAIVRALDDGRRLAFPTLPLGRDEILVAVPEEPRGDPLRRLGTVARAAIARVGPYEVAGHLHGPPCTDPFSLAARRDWVALTDATITYRSRGRLACETWDTVIINRWLTSTLMPADEDELAYARPMAATGVGGRAWFQPAWG